MNRFLLSPSIYNFMAHPISRNCYCVDKNGLIWQQQKNIEFNVPRCECYAFVNGTTSTTNETLDAVHGTPLDEIQGTMQADVNMCTYCSPAGSNLNFNFDCTSNKELSFTLRGISAQEVKCTLTGQQTSFSILGQGLLTLTTTGNTTTAGFKFYVALKQFQLGQKITRGRYYSLVFDSGVGRYEFAAWPPVDASNTFDFGKCEGA
jgi:hypothetical protein